MDRDQHIGRTGKRNDAGRVFLWKYLGDGKAYRGWHLTADAAGCARVSEAIGPLLDGCESETENFATSTVTPSVLAVPNNRRAKAQSAIGLRVRVHSDSRNFSLEERDQVLTITAGRERLEELQQNIIGITRNQGDFAMVPDGKRHAPDQALWFWWLLP